MALRRIDYSGGRGDRRRQTVRVRRVTEPVAPRRHARNRRNEGILREQRELKLRVARLQRLHAARHPELDWDRRQLERAAIKRRQEVSQWRVQPAWEVPVWLTDPRWLKAAGVVVMASLLFTWNVWQWREMEVSLEDNSFRPRPLPAAVPMRNQALAYAGRVLNDCRNHGRGALRGYLAEGLPGYLCEVSEKALARYLAAPDPALSLAAIERRRDALFVRYSGTPDIRLTVHLRERGPGEYALIAVE